MTNTKKTKMNLGLKMLLLLEEKLERDVRETNQ